MSVEAIDHGQANRTEPRLKEAASAPDSPDADIISLPRKPETHETADQTDTAVIASAIEDWLETSYVEQPDGKPTVNVPRLAEAILTSTVQASQPGQDANTAERDRKLKVIINGADTFTNFDLRAEEHGSAYHAIATFLEDTRSRTDSAQFAAQRKASRALLDLAAAIYTEKSRTLVFTAPDVDTSSEQQPMLDTLKGTDDQEDTLTAIAEIATVFKAYAEATAESRRAQETPPVQEAPKPAASQRPPQLRRPPTGGNTRRG